MRRLFLKFVYSSVLAGVHDPEAGRFFKRNAQHGDRTVCFFRLMEIEHLVVIHLVDMVARQNENIFGRISVNKVEILINGVRGPLVPVGAVVTLVRRQDHNSAEVAVKIPRLTVADIFVKLKRLILRQHTDGVDTRIDTV